MANIVWTSTENNFATNTAKIGSNVTGTDWMSFLDALGWMENNGKYGGLGGFNNAYAGMYQAGNGALNTIRFYTGVGSALLGVSNQAAFATNPIAEDIAAIMEFGGTLKADGTGKLKTDMYDLVLAQFLKLGFTNTDFNQLLNHTFRINYVDSTGSAVGTTSITLTQAGISAAAHLMGQGAMGKALADIWNECFEANGTPISTTATLVIRPSGAGYTYADGNKVLFSNYVSLLQGYDISPMVGFNGPADFNSLVQSLVAHRSDKIKDYIGSARQTVQLNTSAQYNDTIKSIMTGLSLPVYDVANLTGRVLLTGAATVSGYTAQSDLIYGFGNGAQVLSSGDGNDTLVGGKGDDTLMGGAGNDIYRFNTGDGNDTILDSDGVGRLLLNGQSLPNGATVVKPGEIWKGEGSITYTKTGNDLTIAFGAVSPDDGVTIKNFNFGAAFDATNADGYLGIKLNRNQKIGIFNKTGLAKDYLQGVFSGGSLPSVANMAEGAVQSFTAAVAVADDKMQVIKVKVQGAATNVLYGILGAHVIPLTNGELTLTLQPNQGQVTFAIWDKGAITSDQTFTLNATLMDATGTAVAQSNDIAVTLHNVDDPTTLPTPPQTTRTIQGDLTPLDFNPPNKVYRLDDLGNVVTNGTAQPGRADFLYDSAGNDLIDAGGGDDTIEAVMGGDNYIKAGDGNDSVDGGAGNDYVEAGAGDDVVTTFAGDDRVLGGAGRDTLRGDVFRAAGGKDMLEGGADADIVYGMAGDDRVYGDDYLSVDDAIAQGATATPGTGRGDLVEGMDGNDTVVGSNRADLVTGGDGNDILVGGAGDDILEGDTVFNASTSDWTASVVQNVNTYTFTFNGVSRISEGAGDDRIYAGAGNDGVLGGAGGDFIDAGTGNDTVFGEAGDDQMLGGDGDDVLVGDNSISSLVGSQHGNDFIDGGAGNDKIIGNGGNDALFGGDGNDTIVGDAPDIVNGGDDYINAEAGDDQVFAGTGNDTLLGGDGNDTLVGDNGGTDTAGGADFIDGGAGNDQLLGQAGNDTLQGGDGTDFLQGDGGDDQLDGGAGNDTMLGGEGDDRLAGGADNDQLQGGAGTDWLDGGAGTDTMFGDAGNDMLQGGDGGDWLQGDAGDDFLDGGAGADTMLGGDGADMLAGGNDNDWLQGDAGDDQLDGGAGADTLFGVTGQDILAGGDGNDLLIGDSGGADSAADGADTLDGGAGNDQLYGQGGDDLLQGGEGDDSMIGGTGNDTMIGGDGNDAYFYDLGGGIDHISDSGGFDFVVFGSGITWDSVQLGLGSLKIGFGANAGELHIDDFDPSDPYNSGSIEFFQFADGSVHSYAELLAKGFNIGGTPDADQLFGTAVNDTIHGLAGDDLVDGGAGNDQLYGDGGNDTLFGGDGDDHLYGGDGDDLLAGNAGTDILEGGAGNDVYVFALGDGQDTVIDSVGSDTIDFGAGITASNLRAARVGDDLVFSMTGTTDSLTVKDWFINAQGVGQIVLGDGAVLDRAGILDLMKNAPPIVIADAVSVKEDTTLTASGNALANDLDPEGRTLRVTNPGSYSGTYGTMTLGASGAFSYTLNNGAAAVQSLAAGQTAADIFTYIVTDDDPNGAMTSASTITVNVAGTNDAPVTVIDRSGVIEDQTTAATGNVLANDSDVDSGTILRVAAPGTYNSAYGTLTLAVNGDATYTLNNAASAVQSLGAGATVVDHFSYAATDGIVSTPGSIDVTITGRNDAPVLTAPIADVGASPNASFSLTLASSTFTDPDAGDALTWSARLADGTALPSWLGFDAGTHTFSGRVPKTATGYLDVLVAATDRSAASASDVFRITFGASHGGGGGSNGGGGNGNGNGSVANAGVGNGQDAPPPGQSYNFNDGAGTAPGNPGAKGGNGYTPHAVAPVGPAPGASATPRAGMSAKSVGVAPGFASDHGGGQSTNNGHHNGIDNGVGLTKAAWSGATAKSLQGASADQALSDGSAQLQSWTAETTFPPPGPKSSTWLEPASSPGQFGDVARYFAQLPRDHVGLLTQGEIARQWAVIGSALAAFGAAGDSSHEPAAADSAALVGEAGDVPTGWGYAGSTGSSTGTQGLPSFRGLTEGFSKLG